MIRMPDTEDLQRLTSHIPLPQNVPQPERSASVVGGAALLALGILTHKRASGLATLAGGLLLFRGVTGYCPFRQLAEQLSDGAGQAESAVLEHDEGITVEHSVTVNRPAEELYRFWRTLENLPAIMDHLESVTLTGNGSSHWVAKGPAGTRVEWDAEIINEVPYELIGWRSLPDSGIANAGSVHFTPTGTGLGTEVRVRLRYDPQIGRAGAFIAKLFRREPGQQLAADLARFRDRMESGDLT